MDADVLEKLLCESECTYHDFKREQYKFDKPATDEEKSELLKDILAFANSGAACDAHILIGVEEVKGGMGKVHGIASELRDNDLQQFVNTKTQRPISFLHEIVQCEGKKIGVITIHAQKPPFYLKVDFGKLRKDLVYYRLGSSTRVAAAEELIAWGRTSALNKMHPRLDLAFARIRQPGLLIGGSARNEVARGTTTVLVEKQMLRLQDIPRNEFPGKNPWEQEHQKEYLERLNRFLPRAKLHAPMGLFMRNDGEVAALDVRARLSVANTGAQKIIAQEHYPARPIRRRPQTRPQASYTGFGESDITVAEEDGRWQVEWKIPKLLPGDQLFSDGVFFVFATEPGALQFEVRVLAENLPQPKCDTLVLDVQVTKPKMDTADLFYDLESWAEKYSEFDATKNYSII
jgi:hypothetical protein